MNNLFTAQFWFNQSPGTLIPSSQYLLFGLIIFFVLAALAGFFLKKRRDFFQPLWGRLINFMSANAIVGLLLYFFSQQLVPFLSARIWFALWGIGLIVWAAFIIAYAKKLPAKKKKFTEEKAYQKYLP